MKDMMIGVIGTGTMGGGIAQMFAENGFKVLLWDICEKFTAQGYENIAGRLDKSVEKGKLAASDADAILKRITVVNELSDLASAGLIIEAIIEDFSTKKDLFSQLEKHLSPKTVIGSNTSSLSIGCLAETVSRKERFVGIHFFNPPTKLELVEVISTPHSSPNALQQVNDVLAECGKRAVAVKDSPGFIVNRLLIPYINEAAKLIDEEVADPDAIDTAMRLGALHPSGPLQVADLIGLDICKNILESLSVSLNNPSYKPAKSIVARVAAGHLGRKSGQGFYSY